MVMNQQFMKDRPVIYEVNNGYFQLVSSVYNLIGSQPFQEYMHTHAVYIHRPGRPGSKVTMYTIPLGSSCTHSDVIIFVVAAVLSHLKVGSIHESEMFSHGDCRAGENAVEVEAVAHVLQHRWNSTACVNKIQHTYTRAYRHAKHCPPSPKI